MGFCLGYIVPVTKPPTKSGKESVDSQYKLPTCYNPHVVRVFKQVCQGCWGGNLWTQIHALGAAIPDPYLDGALFLQPSYGSCVHGFPSLALAVQVFSGVGRCELLGLWASVHKIPMTHYTLNYQKVLILPQDQGCQLMARSSPWAAAEIITLVHSGGTIVEIYHDSVYKVPSQSAVQLQLQLQWAKWSAIWCEQSQEGG